MLLEKQLKVQRVATLDPGRFYFNLLQKTDILVEVNTGAVLVPYYTSNREKRYKKVSGGIWAALRQQDHIILDTYGLSRDRLKGELEELLSMITELEKARDAIEKTISPSPRALSRQTFNRIAHKLTKKINYLKKEAGDKLLGAAGPFDSLGRRNPSAKMTQATAAIKRLKKRINDIFKIITRIKYRERVIIKDISLIRSVLLESLGTVITNASPGNLLETKQQLLRIYSSPYRREIRQIAAKLTDIAAGKLGSSGIATVRQKIIQLVYTFTEK